MSPARAPVALWCGLALASALAAPAAEAQDVDAILAGCPGGAAWLAAEQARRDALRLPPESPPRQPALREQLLGMRRDDQAARSFSAQGRAPTKPEAATLEATDARHLARLQAIVRERGFPRAVDVGRDGVAAAWLLVQHADADPAFQQRVLAQLDGLGEAEGISGEQRALLTDRVLLAQGKPQRYGSQYQGGPGARPAMRPVEDPARLDQRRARMHLMPAATYACFLDRMSRPATGATAP